MNPKSDFRRKELTGVGGDDNVLLLVVLEEVLLEKARVALDLVDEGLDTGRLGDGVDHGRREVGNTDSLGLASVEELDHGLPSVDNRDRGVDLALAVLLREEVRVGVALSHESNGPAAGARHIRSAGLRKPRDAHRKKEGTHWMR